MSKEPHKKLSNRDIAFGIGRKATDEEMKEYLSFPVGGFKDAVTVLKEIKEHLEVRRQKLF